MNLIITSFCQIAGNQVVVNDRLIHYEENISKFADFAKSVYRRSGFSYPKFFKMDALGKLGFLACELVLQNKGIAGYAPERVGVVLSNSSSSLDTDISHQETIKDRSAWFPSPSVFVYTLPNIVIGEVCIRNGIKGENAFFISEVPDPELIEKIARELFENDRVDACLTGWTEVLGLQYSAKVMLVERESATISEANGDSLMIRRFDAENIERIIKTNN
jgi:hypothetical protein